MPPSEGQQSVPEWLLRLATAVVGGKIAADAGFRERAFDPKAFDEVRRELAALPAEAPFAEWGRWFLADRATRLIGPGLKISRTEAEELTSDKAENELVALNRRAGALEQTRHLAEAPKIAQQALELLKAHPEWETRAISDWFWSLAANLIRTGQAGEAEPLARACLAMRQRVYTEGMFQIPSARRIVGWSLLDQKRYAEAEPLLLSAYEEMKQMDARVGGLVGVQQTGFLATAGHLADLYKATQQSAKAAEWRQKAAPPPAPVKPAGNP